MNKERDTVSYKHKYAVFTGLDNSNDPVKFAVGEGGVKLSAAVNVNITRTMSIERRDGYSLWKSGSYKSLWSNGAVCYAVNDDDLVELLQDGSENLLVSRVGQFTMSFVDARNGYVYYSNGLCIGKIKDSVAYTLGTTTDKFKATLPPGDFLSYLSPRLLVVKDNVIFISDPINRDVYHQHIGFIQFDTNIRMIAPVGQSLFVSDSKFTWFLTKTQQQLVSSPLFSLKKVASYPAISGNPVKAVEGIKTELGYYPDAAMWISETGICIGGAEGNFENLTDKKYEMPGLMHSACVEHRIINDLNLFISVIKGI